MRKQSKRDLALIHNERDMLNGNINRMCISDDEHEINFMLVIAIQRLMEIRRISLLRFYEEEWEGES